MNGFVKTIFAGAMMVVLFGMQSCASSKGCGCGNDINRSYAPRR